MPTKKVPDRPAEQAAAEKFQQFQRDYGGDAVNAHDDRMDSVLDENAEELDREIASRKRPAH